MVATFTVTIIILNAERGKYIPMKAFQKDLILKIASTVES